MRWGRKEISDFRTEGELHVPLVVAGEAFPAAGAATLAGAKTNMTRDGRRGRTFGGRGLMDLGQGRRGLAGTWKPRRAAATPGLRIRAASDGAGGACEKFRWEEIVRRGEE